MIAQVHEHDMKVGMKNAVELMDTTSALYDFALNEECFTYDECDVSPQTNMRTSFYVREKRCPSIRREDPRLF